MKKFLSIILCVAMLFSVATASFTVSAAASNTVKTSITKIESKAKGFKVTFKKKSKIKGYQIQYSTSSKFKSSVTKTKTISSYKTTSATISKLKGCNVKYYVRVRTYKVSNGKKIYSSWSKTKTVTTLKHKYSKATCTKPKTCKYCEKTSGKKLGHKYSNACDTKCNVCKAKRTAPHKYTDACDTKCNLCKKKRTAPHKYTDACDTKCNLCKKKRTAPHKYSNACDTTCNLCKAKRTTKHKYKDATCTKPKTCSVCNKTSGKALGHIYAHSCDTICNVCDAERKITHKYESATCTKPKTCSVCQETSGEALGHNYENNACTRCGIADSSSLQPDTSGMTTVEVPKSVEDLSKLTTYDLLPSIKVAASLMKTAETADVSNADYISDMSLTTEAIKSLRKVTDERIKDIRNTPNIVIPSDAKVYYISNSGNDKNDGLTPETAWASLAKASSVKGSSKTKTYVLFERGGLWRGQLVSAKYVTYSAYGQGEKPKLYASPFDAGGSKNANLWVESSENIWTITSSELTHDIGALIFDNSSYSTKKFRLADVKSDLHFYHDYTNGVLYLYSTSNPATRFKSIEFNVGFNIIEANSHITVDNLCLKFGGRHGVATESADGITVKNCEFGWIGGSLHTPGQGQVRLGNAIEIYGYCADYTVIDNYIYQIYDAGITQQVTLTDNTLRKQERILYSGNVIENCNYSIEYWITSSDNNPSYIDTFLIEDNLMWYAGHGLCETRSDKLNACHINGWRHFDRNRAQNYVIRDNVMIDSLNQIFNIYTTQTNPDGSDSMPIFNNNIIFNKQSGNFGVLRQGEKGDTSWPSTVKLNDSLFNSVSDVFNGDVIGMISFKLYKNGKLNVQY